MAKDKRRYDLVLKYRTLNYVDAVALEHLRGGGDFDANRDVKRVMAAVGWAKLVTDVLAAQNMIDDADVEGEE